jgi:hypothetical protein
MLRHLLFTTASLAALGSAASAQILIMPDSTANALVSFDPMDGSVLNPSMFPLQGGTQIGAIDVNGEVWVSEQIGDRISRWDINGNSLGVIGPIHAGGGLDNIRGLTLIGNTVYVTNSGTANGAPGNAVVLFDTSGAYISHFITTGLAPSPFSLILHQGDLLVASSSANDDVHRFTQAGVTIGTFHNSTALNFAHQISPASDGNVWVGGFSSNNVVKLDATSGNVLFSFTASGARGVYELGNGNVMWTNGSGAHIYNMALGTSSLVHAGGGRHLNLYGGGGPPSNAFCFGDGSGTACPCGNAGAPGRGCENGALTGGALLTQTGGSSVSSGTVALHGTGLQPSQPGLYFQGNNAVAGGMGAHFGDGLRCAGGGLRRLQIRTATPLGESSTTVDIATAGLVSAGDVKRYQIWYRNPANSPCGTTFNLSNGIEITWTP